jgi:uncharacterized protein YodC (DUF2158 family)
MSDFETGDLVELKSGGPKMTIEKLGNFFPGGPINGALCVWFEGFDHGVGHPQLPLERATAREHRRQGACEDADVMLRGHTRPRQ